MGFIGEEGDAVRDIRDSHALYRTSACDPDLFLGYWGILGILGTATYFSDPLSRFTRHLDWHNYPTHLDLSRFVRHTGTANHFVVTSSNITKGVEGSKNKAGNPRMKIRISKLEIRPRPGGNVNKHE